MKFNLLALYSEQSQFRNEADSADADARMLEAARSALGRIDSHPGLTASNGVNLELGAGLPPDANPWLVSQLDEASRKRLFWLGLKGKGPLALYLALPAQTTEMAADLRAATILAAINSPYSEFSEEARRTAEEILSLRPVLTAAFISPVSIEFNPKVLSALREVSLHLADARLGT